jgi:hypothetical protein
MLGMSPFYHYMLIKALNYCAVQLAELLNVEFYGEWIGLVAEFTTRSLLSWQVCLTLIA